MNDELFHSPPMSSPPEGPCKEDDSKEEKKPWIRWFLESSGGTALLTLIIGGLITGFVTHLYQQNEKEREFQQMWLKARGDQSLVAYKEYLDKEQAVVTRAYELIGQCISSGEDVVIVTGPDFVLKNYQPKYRPDIDKQRTAAFDKYNEVELQWRNEQDKLGLLMGYYHRGSPEVTTAWHKVQASVTKFMCCAAKRWSKYDESHPPTGEYDCGVPQECDVDKKEIRTNLDDLTKALEGSRRYSWEGWESPEQLRQALGIKN